jgi:hypothetical protein
VPYSKETILLFWLEEHSTRNEIAKNNIAGIFSFID